MARASSVGGENRVRARVLECVRECECVGVSEKCAEKLAQHRHRGGTIGNTTHRNEEREESTGGEKEQKIPAEKNMYL